MSKASQSGVVRILIFAYGVLALAALGRSSFELATKFDEAPVPYSLSAAAAVLYVLVTIALVKNSAAWRRFARWVISIELAFVIIVGVLSIIDESIFPAKTVWSSFGVGYGFTPLALPIIGLIWLARGVKH